VAGEDDTRRRAREWFEAYKRILPMAPGVRRGSFARSLDDPATAAATPARSLAPIPRAASRQPTRKPRRDSSIRPIRTPNEDIPLRQFHRYPNC